MNFKILVILLFFIQCSDPKPKADVEFELLNEELYFAPIFSNKIGGVEMFYGDYLSEEDEEKGRNVIKYKVKNNLPYKVFFIPNSQKLEQIWDVEDFYAYDLYFLSYLITKENGQNLEMRIPLSYPPKNPAISDAVFLKDSTEWAQDTIKYYSMYDRRRFKDFTFLEPGETAIFDIEFNLPIIKGSNELYSDVIELYKEENYIFQLHYIQSKTRLEDELPKQILDYLERNDIKIVDLSLHSDKIPLMPRK
jgi:hypothetical protein